MNIYQKRIQDIRRLLSSKELDAVLVSSGATVVFLTGFNNFSIDEREAYLIITKKSQYVITDARYTEAVKKEVPHFKLLERGAELSLKQIFNKFKNIKNLGIEEDNLTVTEYKFIKKYFKKTKDLDLKLIREIKDPEEVEKITKACKLGDKVFDFILDKIKPGVSEKEIALEMEMFVKKNGAQLSFDPIIAFGANSSVPHHQTSDKRLTINDKLVLLDFGIKHQDYCSDMTRTIFLEKPSEKQQDIYQTVLAAQSKAAEFIQTELKSERQVIIGEVDQIAREVITNKNYPDLPHSLGHGIGLQVHEYPFLYPTSKEIFEEGMVFSIEPGIYLEGFGGVRIEDLYTIKGDQLISLTKADKNLCIIN